MVLRGGGPFGRPGQCGGPGAPGLARRHRGLGGPAGFVSEGTGARVEGHPRDTEPARSCCRSPCPPSLAFTPHAPRGGSGRRQRGEGSDTGARGCWDEPPPPPCPLPRPSTPPLMGHACPGLHLEGFVPGGWSQRAHTAKELEPSAYAPRGAHVWAVGVCASKATPTNTQCPAGKPTASPLTGGGSGRRLIETGGAACSLPASPDLEVRGMVWPLGTGASGQANCSRLGC